MSISFSTAKFFCLITELGLSRFFSIYIDWFMVLALEGVDVGCA